MDIINVTNKTETNSVNRKRWVNRFDLIRRSWKKRMSYTMINLGTLNIKMGVINYR